MARTPSTDWAASATFSTTGPSGIRSIRSWMAGRSNRSPLNPTTAEAADRIAALDRVVHVPLHTKMGFGGGRNLGEACHIYDLFTYLTGARIERVQAAAIRQATGYYRRQDNFTACLSFDDGSVATLTYTGLGSKDYPKERLEMFVDGKVIALDDYKTLTVTGGKGRGVRTRLPEKGQREELEAFAKSIQSGGEWPIPLWEQSQATRIALEVEDALNGAAACAAS